MRAWMFFVVLTACAAVCPVDTNATENDAPMDVTHPKVQHRVNPLGVDVPQPVFSWELTSGDRGQTQAAYQVLVSRTRDEVLAGQGTLWDSGRVAGSQTVQVRYEGRPLQSHQDCWWTVRVWNQDDVASAWSEPAHWSVGLLHPEDQTAAWIGHDGYRPRVQAPAPLAGASWLMHPQDPQPAPEGYRLYVKRFDLPDDIAVEYAELLTVGDDKLWVALNRKTLVHGEPGWAQVKPVVVTEVLQPGFNELRINVHNETDGPTGVLGKLFIKTSDGETIVLQSDESWLCSNTPGQHWAGRDLDDAELTACNVVGPYGIAPWGESLLRGLHLPPVLQLATTFQLKKPVTSAKLYISALGLCEPYLNGERVSDEFFTPGWTDYNKRVYYRTYDVTDRLTMGANAIGATLADGWYSGYIGWGQNRDHYGDAPRLWLQLQLSFADGSHQLIQSGPDWRATTGPTRSADFLMGETYDARQAVAQWCLPDTAFENWQVVTTGAAVSPQLSAHPGPPVVAVREFPAREVTEPRAGTYVFDLGQNFAGVVRLNVDASAGQKIQLRYAERLNPDGTIYITNLRGARATDTYYCRGGGPEEWTPRFTFHGFQYVELTGLPAPPSTDTITGIALSSRTPRAGWFDCSSEMLNQLHNNIYWTQRANFIDIPTDCPQRDERMGWTGDAQIYVQTAALNADVHAFFDKWLVDLTDAQRADGQFPMVAPLKVAGDDGGPAWADAGVICPWTIYEVYGDRQLLARQYPSMKRFVDFCISRSTPELLPPEEFHCFGDWLNIEADTPSPVIYTAYFAISARTLAAAAEVLGHTEDAARYRDVYQRIKAAFNEAYVDDAGHVSGQTQCAYVLALAADLLDGSRRQQAAAHLVADIEARGGHLSTGFVGTKDLMLVLAKIGRNDVAYRLLMNEDYPSWGFSIRNGATSIWERWDGWTPDKGFQDPGMNSFAHYSFGAVYQWMVEAIGGIQNGGNSYQQIRIAPTPGGGLHHARTTYHSVRGPIISDWQDTQDAFTLNVSFPANTTAIVVVAGDDADQVTEGGKPLSDVAAIGKTSVQDGRTLIEVGSGEYSFKVSK